MELLVIEVDSSLGRSLEFSLSLLGHSVVVVVTADDALARVQERGAGEPFALILLGMVDTLDDMDTLNTREDDARLALCRALRETLGGASARLLLLSPRDEEAVIVAALDAGADGYLSVPLDPTEMRDQLARAEQRQSRSATPQSVSSSTPAPDIRADEQPVPDAILSVARGFRIGVDVAGSVVWADAACVALLGRSRDSLVGSSTLPLVHPDDAAAWLRLISVAADGLAIHDAGSRDTRLMTGDGTWREFDVQATSLLADDAVGAIVLEAYDISQRKAREQQSLWQTVFDPQTGLPHRGSFQLYLNHALARADRRGESIVMMFMDIDNLRRVNEVHGRGAGDQVVTVAASRLRASLRATDTAARVGGDEFNILLEDVASEAEAVAIAERIIREVGAPYDLAGLPSIAISASLGVAFSHPGTRRGPVDLGPDGDSQVDALLRRADMALSRAKASGKARWELFSPRPATAARPSPAVSGAGDAGMT